MPHPRRPRSFSSVAGPPTARSNGGGCAAACCHDPSPTEPTARNGKRPSVAGRARALPLAPGMPLHPQSPQASLAHLRAAPREEVRALCKKGKGREALWRRVPARAIPNGACKAEHGWLKRRVLLAASPLVVKTPASPTRPEGTPFLSFQVAATTRCQRQRDSGPTPSRKQPVSLKGPGVVLGHWPRHEVCKENVLTSF